MFRSDQAAGAGRVSDGTRTRDFLDHNQVLYQLSYTHHLATGRSRRRSKSTWPRPVSRGGPPGSGDLRTYDTGGASDAATACASSLVGPGGATNRVCR